jgi:ribosome-associated translation inhibitor RaiA
MKIVFKNGLESEFIKNAMNQHMEVLEEKHPELQQTDAIVTVKMDNSPLQAGPDSYTVNIRLIGGRNFRNISLHKTAQNFYSAMNAAFHVLAQKLSKKSEKKRGLIRQRRRQFKQELVSAELAA